MILSNWFPNISKILLKFYFNCYPSSVRSSCKHMFARRLQADRWLTADGWGQSVAFCINMRQKRPLFFPKRPLFFSKRPLFFSKRPPFLQSLLIRYKSLRNLDKSRVQLHKYTITWIFMHYLPSKTPIRQPSAIRQPINLWQTTVYKDFWRMTVSN